MRLASVFLLFLISTSVSANSAWLQSAKIKMIYPVSDGSVILTFHEDSTTSSFDCMRADKYHYIRPNAGGVTPEAAKNMLSVALTAASTGKEISMNYVTDSSICVVKSIYIVYE